MTMPFSLSAAEYKPLAMMLPDVSEETTATDRIGAVRWTAQARKAILELAESSRARVVHGDETKYGNVSVKDQALLEPGDGPALSDWVDQQVEMGRTVLVGRGFPLGRQGSFDHPSFTPAVVLLSMDHDEQVIAWESAGVAGVPYPIFAEPGTLVRLGVNEPGRWFIWGFALIVVGIGVQRLVR